MGTQSLAYVNPCQPVEKVNRAIYSEYITPSFQLSNSKEERIKRTSIIHSPAANVGGPMPMGWVY